MKPLLLVMGLLVIAFWFGTCAGHYANSRAEVVTKRLEAKYYEPAN